MATFVLFFIAEIGDKTQIATVLLAAKYDSLIQVITGTTLGMMLANVPVVLLGKLRADKLPSRDPHCLRHPLCGAWHLHPDLRLTSHRSRRGSA